MQQISTKLLLAVLTALGNITVVLSEEPPPLPDLPDQFYLKIEANLNSTHTVYMEEIYDGPGNRGSAMKFASNQSTLITYDYNNLQRVSVTWDEDGTFKTCNVTNLTAGSFTIFGFHFVNGTVRIESTADLFRFGKQYNETYVGQEVVRGIPVNHWKTTLAGLSDTFYDLHYYFSVEGYHAATDGLEVPVRATVNGTAPNEGMPGTHAFSNVYEYFEVHLGLPWWRDPFEVPLGIPCVGRLSHKDLPRLPEVFNMRGEILVLSRRQFSSSFSVHYNYPGKMTAFIYYHRNSNSSVNSLTKVIHDLNYGLTYTLDMNNDSCRVSDFKELRHFEPDVVIAKDGTHVFLQNPTDFFIPVNQTWAYEGESTFRGLDVESWISEPDIYNRYNMTWSSTTEVFFASVNFSSGGFPKYITHIPVRRIHRTYIHRNKTSEKLAIHKFFLDIFAFDHEMYEPWVYDTSACFGEDEQTDLAFDLAGKGIFQRYVVNNSRNFYHGIHASIAEVIQLPGTRITNLQGEEGTDKVMTIFCTLLGVPKIQGNAVNSTQNHSIPLDKAEDKLESAIDKGIQVKFETHEGETISIDVVKGSLRNKFTPDKEAEMKGVSAGVAVGVAFTTLIIGALIGGIVVTVLQRKYNYKFPYLIQK